MSDALSLAATAKAAPIEAQQVVAPGPAPKVEASSAHRSVPTAEEIIHPQAPSLNAADEQLLGFAIHTYTNAIYTQLNDALTSTLGYLAEPVRKPDDAVAARLLGALVDGLTTVALNLVGGGLVEAALSFGGAAAGAAVRSAVQSASRSGGQAAGEAVKNAVAPGATRFIPPNTEAGLPEDPGAPTLLKEFGARQKHQLAAQQANAEILVAAIRPQSPSELEELRILARTLQSNTNQSVAGLFQRQVTYGWMNFCAAIALGEKQTASEPDIVGANEAGGVARTGGKGIQQWHGGHDGFIDVEIDLPDRLMGLEGLQLASMKVEGSEGAARILRNTETPLLGTPVYRRVWIGHSGQGALGWDPALILSPDGGLSVDVDNATLAAIGQMQPLARDAVSKLDQEIVELEQRGESLSTPKDGVRLEALHAQRMARARYAQLGGFMLVSWLSQFSTTRLA